VHIFQLNFTHNRINACNTTISAQKTPRYLHTISNQEAAAPLREVLLNSLAQKLMEKTALGD
jgi:hypothetical protein